MKMHPCTLTILLSALAIGCQAPPPPPTAPGPAAPEQITRIREQLRAQDPRVDVGVVASVLESEMLAAVGDVNVSAFKEGETVCFMDSTTAPLVCGKVVRITADQVHVKYESPSGDRRAPSAGDLAVAFH